MRADGFKVGQVFYMNPEDLLPIDRFTKKSALGPKGPKPAGGKQFGGRPQGGRPGQGQKFQGGGNRQGGGNFRGGHAGGHTKPIYKK